MSWIQAKINLVIGVHTSTISRAVRWNQGLRGYRPQQTHRLTLARRKSKAPRRIAAEAWHLVDRLLGEQWSPEQICGWLHQTQSVRLSHEWIDQHVLQDKSAHGTLDKQLRCQRQRWKR